MALPSIKSLIVDALTGKIALERVQREFMLDKYIKIYKPRNLHGIPRSNYSYQNFLQGLANNGVTTDDLDQWTKDWHDLVHSCEKRAKIRKLNEVSIENILKTKLSGTGIKYQMRKQQYRVALTLTMTHNTQATFYILHSKFREQLEMILPAVEQLNNLMDELGQGIRLKAFDRNAKWNEIE